MPRNIEIKARIDSIASVAVIAATLADHGPETIDQDDTFFPCASAGGRLKLRAFADGSGELIFYRRADVAGPKESFYVRSPTPSPDTLREALTLAHGAIGRVRKRRLLYLVGRTRVHLDDVDGLGPHMELEVVLADTESAEDGVRVAKTLMQRLGVSPTQCIEGAYLDLLAAKRQASS